MNRESLVYLDRVYSGNDAKSCPVMLNVIAGPEEFDRKIIYGDTCGGGCGCGCCSCGVDEGASYDVTSVEVIVNHISLGGSATIDPDQVTVDGYPVDGINFFNDRYAAGTNNLMPLVSRCECMEKGLPTLAYLLMTDIGPWEASLSFIIRGKVSGCNGTRDFRLCLTPRSESTVLISGTSTFSLPDIQLPCIADGFAPVINFSFGGEGNLLSPILTADTESGGCAFTLSGRLVFEPTVSVEITRRTLFRTSATPVLTPCDGLTGCRECNCIEDEEEEEKELCGGSCEKKKNHDICCQWNGYNGFTY